MAMVGIPRLPTVCRPLFPPGPQDPSLQSGALPFALPPCPCMSLLPLFPFSHFCEHLAVEAAVSDPGGVGVGCEGGHGSPLGDTHPGEGRSTTTAPFWKWGTCWRLGAMETVRGLEGGLRRPLGIFTEETADVDLEGRARKLHINTGATGRRCVQSVEAW